MTPAGRRDPLLKGLPPEVRIMQLHEDSFDLPAGAVRLMSNGVCANQGLRVGRTTYGFQFHFEVTKADAVNFPRDCWSSLERHYGEMAELVAADVVRSVEAHFDGRRRFLAPDHQPLARPRDRTPRLGGASATGSPARLSSVPRSPFIPLAPDFPHPTSRARLAMKPST